MSISNEEILRGLHKEHSLLIKKAKQNRLNFSAEYAISKNIIKEKYRQLQAENSLLKKEIARCKLDVRTDTTNREELITLMDTNNKQFKTLVKDFKALAAENTLLKNKLNTSMDLPTQKTSGKLEKTLVDLKELNVILKEKNKQIQTLQSEGEANDAAYEEIIQENSRLQGDMKQKNTLIQKLRAAQAENEKVCNEVLYDNTQLRQDLRSFKRLKLFLGKSEFTQQQRNEFNSIMGSLSD
jgi:hypothetical protein